MMPNLTEGGGGLVRVSRGLESRLTAENQTRKMKNLRNLPERTGFQKIWQPWYWTIRDWGRHWDRARS